MASQLQLRRGTTVQHVPFIGAPAEVTVDTDKKTLVVHDGTTPGGFPSATAAELAAGLTTKVSVGAAAGGALSGTYPNPTLAPVIATGSTTARSVQDRFADILNVKDFGAVGDGVANDAAAINAAINAVGARGIVYLPAGTYLVKSAILVHRNDLAIVGDGVGVTIIKMDEPANLLAYSAIDIRTDRANNNAGANLARIRVQDLSIDGNKANITATAGNGITVLVSSNHKIEDVSIINVHAYDCANSGLLLGGLVNLTDDAYKVERAIVHNCSFYDNDGVGLSQYKTNNTTITSCSMYRNGLENLTIDVFSQGCIVDGNRFFRHYGGTGNLGVDSGDVCVISNNFIDNENDTTAASGFRTGIALNSQRPSAGGSTDVVISGNVIVRCSDYGILAHDDTGMGGDSVGSAVIVGNTFGANGTDVRIETGAGPTILKANKLQTISITEPTASDIRFGAGEISWNAGLTSSATIAVTAADTAFHKISFTSLSANRFTSLSSGEILLPCGGLYTFSARIRAEGLDALDANWVSVGVRHTPTGGGTSTLIVENVDRDAGAFVDDVTELQVTGTFLVDAGTLGVYFRADAANSGNVTISQTTSTRFTGAVLG